MADSLTWRDRLRGDHIGPLIPGYRDYVHDQNGQLALNGPKS
jgi:hypothetical protein